MDEIEIYDFYYYEVDDEIIFLGEKKLKDSLCGKIAIKKPYWSDLYEINRLSSKMVRNKETFKKERKLDITRIRQNKIKTLLYSIEDHEDNDYNITRDYIDELNIGLADFILKKIDITIKKCNLKGLTPKESDELSLDCYNYFLSSKQHKADRTKTVSEPPAIIILYRISQMLSISIDEVMRMDKKIIDSIMIMNEQEANSKNFLVAKEKLKTQATKINNEMNFSGNSVTAQGEIKPNSLMNRVPKKTS